MADKLLVSSTMSLRALMVVMALAVAACAASGDEEDTGEAVGSDEADLVSINPTRPIALHNAFLQHHPDVTNQPSGAATAKLRATNVENVLVISQPPTNPEARAWGGKLASHVPARVIDDPTRSDTLLAHIADFPAFVPKRVSTRATPTSRSTSSSPRRRASSSTPTRAPTSS